MTDKYREAAFKQCMGDVKLPSCLDVNYETFIFNCAWQAATERAKEREREFIDCINAALPLLHLHREQMSIAASSLKLCKKSQIKDVDMAINRCKQALMKHESEAE